MVRDNTVQMVLLVGTVEIRIDIDHTDREEDTVSNTIDEYHRNGCKNSNVTGGI